MLLKMEFYKEFESDNFCLVTIIRALADKIVGLKNKKLKLKYLHYCRDTIIYL